MYLVDNKYFDKGHFEKEKNRLRPEEFKRRYEGEFQRMEGLVWEIPQTSTVDDSVALQKALSFPDRIVGGIDWSPNKPAGIVIAYVKNSVFWIVAEWKEEGKTLSEVIDQAKTFKNMYNVNIWYPDPKSPDQITEMKRAGLQIGDVSKDLSLGISRVSSLLQEKRMFFLKECEEVIGEIEQYHFEEDIDGKTKSGKPKQENDQLCNALRFLAIGYNPPDPHKVAIRNLDKIYGSKRKFQYE